MQVKKVALGDLKEYENNPRINDRAVDGVAASLAEFGYINPIIVNADNVILAGHTRLKARQKIGIDAVEVLVIDHLTDEQQRAYRLADNRTQERAGWDIGKLASELKSISTIDMERLGFSRVDYGAEELGDIIEDTPPDVNSSPARVSAGDIWQLGEHRLRCIDSTDPAQVQRLTQGRLIDLCITDPPYGVDISNRRRVKIANDNLPERDFVAFLAAAFDNIKTRLKPGGVWYIWYGVLKHPEFKRALEAVGMNISQVLIWNKNQFTLGWSDYRWKHEGCLYGWTDGEAHYFTSDRGQPSVIELPQLEPEKMSKPRLIAFIKQLQEELHFDVLNEDTKKTGYLHPSQKPVNLMAKIMANSSRGGETVLDLFGGTGATLMAAEQLGRVCYMAEMDPRWCDAIIERWEKRTNKKAEKIDKWQN